jgi:hypothetical protein
MGELSPTLMDLMRIGVALFIVPVGPGVSHAIA